MASPWISLDMVIEAQSRAPVGNAQRVNDYISAKAGAPVCDICAQWEIFRNASTQVAHIASVLATTSDFVRGKGRCSICQKERTVTARTRDADQTRSRGACRPLRAAAS